MKNRNRGQGAGIKQDEVFFYSAYCLLSTAYFLKIRRTKNEKQDYSFSGRQS